jgi:hypothetical protein
MGRPKGAKNKLTVEHVAAAKDLAAEFGDPLRDLYIKRSRHEAIYAAEMAKSSRHRNTKKLTEVEEKIRQYNEAILPYDRPKFQAINHTGNAAPAPMVIRAPASISDSKAWLAAYAPKRDDAANDQPAPMVAFTRNVRTVLDIADAVGVNDAQSIIDEASNITRGEDEAAKITRRENKS